jgi:hypothetical protein
MEVFGDPPEHPQFYDLAEIRRQNASWQQVTVEQAFGVPDPGASVGVEPRLSVVIGDLGPDMPIVLDYRISRDEPRILYLGFRPHPSWSVVAVDFASLIRLLGPRG